ncbi:uncharacterized protein NPIL_234782 [Nephila pilipes]|uniref:Uncharacterized protein n=1 Tax=Nephila pilipes TaxID=299642 RepID=A0A8X6QK39_NEPPI|nr:uncharacterized protein NPIL_234782 [Nephila pilipes]
MFCSENTQRIIKYFLFSILTLSPQCFAAVRTVQRWGDDDDDIIYHFSTTRRPYPWERPRPRFDPPTYEPPSSSGQEVIFFCILGIGLVIFLALVSCCKMVANESASSSSTSSTTTHPPPGNYTQRPANVRDDVGITVSFVNSAYSSGGGARNEVDSSTDRPPDYATVTIQDLGNRDTAFPSVVNKPHETPPPKYEDGPVFR